MKIKIERNSNRRMAWTDKVNGYFEFLFSENQENSVRLNKMKGIKMFGIYFTYNIYK